VTTINVDDGAGGAHTLQVGDTAYFFDSVSARYVERTVTARTAGTIGISGAAVTVADNAPISNNLRIALYRSKTSGSTPTLFYLVAEVPNNCFAATQTYDDNAVDAALGALLIPPIQDRSPPPKAKYLSEFQNSMVASGNPDSQRRVFWSSFEGCEYFPSDTNQDDVQTSAGDVITGQGSGGTVFGVFTSQGTHVLSGTLADANTRIETRAPDIGCEGHGSIQNVNGLLCWWSNKGPYCMAQGQAPQPLGQNADGSGRLETLVDQEGKSASETYQFPPDHLDQLGQEAKVPCFSSPARTPAAAKATATTTRASSRSTTRGQGGPGWSGTTSTWAPAPWWTETSFTSRRSGTAPTPRPCIPISTGCTT
jgi:hypothetical protein